MKLIPAALAASCLTFSFGYLAKAANACRVNSPFVIEDIREADVVFSGRLIRYERVPSDWPIHSSYGLLTIRIEKVIKGNVSGDIQLYWPNSTFSIPETMERSEPLLLAAIRPGSAGLPLRGRSATVFPSRRPDLLQVMQAPCSSPFILPYKQKNADNITIILRGGKVEPHYYFDERR